MPEREEVELPDSKYPEVADSDPDDYVADGGDPVPGTL